MVSIAPIPLNYIEFALAFLLLAVLEYKIHLRQLLFGNHRTIYSYFSYAALVSITIGIFGGLNYNTNILLIRALNAGNTGHLISWIAIVLVIYRFGYNDILKGVTYGAAFAALHELVSILFSLGIGSYGASQGVTFIQAAEFYSTFLFLCCSILICFFAFGGIKYKRSVITSVIFLVVYSIAVTITIGGIGTINLLGPTQYFDNVWINAVEQMSWLLPSILFIITSIKLPEKKPETNPFD